MHLNNNTFSVEIIEELPKIFIPKQYDKGSYIVFEIDGESMNDGTELALRSRDRLLCKEIDPYEITNGIMSRRYPFIIVSKMDGIVCKMITENNTDTQTLTLHSLNTRYEDYTIHHNEVLKLIK